MITSSRACFQIPTLPPNKNTVRAGRQDFREVDRAGLRHAEPLACELALAQGVPGCSFLSERHGEGAAAQSLKLSSQALSLFESATAMASAAVTAASAAAALVPF